MAELKLNTPLRADQIEFRVQSVNRGGYATLLAYKNARVDMDRLDAVFGAGYWQRKHEMIGAKEFCSVGIWNKELSQWVFVQDCGSASNTEAEKGQSSDAFKRACFNLGIGRELYAFPQIVVQLKGSGDNPKEEWYLRDPARQGEKPKASAGWGLKLKEWDWYIESDLESGHPVFIAARDQDGEVRYRWGHRISDTEKKISAGNGGAG